MGLKMWCSVCQARGEWTELQIEDGYLQCPACAAEVWPDMDGKFVDELRRRKKEQQATSGYVSLSLPEGVQVRGGADPSGTTPNVGKKKTQKFLYNQLFKET